MLFIFRVDVGTMINLDMNLALETVAHLKSALASYCNIPVDKQVCNEDFYASLKGWRSVGEWLGHSLAVLEVDGWRLLAHTKNISSHPIVVYQSYT